MSKWKRRCVRGNVRQRNVQRRASPYTASEPYSIIISVYQHGVSLIVRRHAHVESHASVRGGVVDKGDVGRN